MPLASTCSCSRSTRQAWSSQSPPRPSPVARDANDFLAEAVKRHPTRFAGLAALAIQAPDEGREGIRALRPPARLQRHEHQRPHARPLSRRSVLLADPCMRMRSVCRFTFTRRCRTSRWPTRSMAASRRPSAAFSPVPGWGWHIETAVHLLRMILGGVFDRHPKLQVVIGHMGEAIPFMLPG